MKFVFPITILILVFHGARSDSEKECFVPAICKHPQFNETVWMPISGGQSQGETAKERTNEGEPEYVRTLVMKNVIDVLCPVKHNNKCFFPLIGTDLTDDEGVEACASIGGHLANIYDQTHMDALMNYIRKSRMAGRQLIALALGMKYDPMNDNLHLRNGSVVTYDLRWLDGFPSRSSADTKMSLLVDLDESASIHYLFNFPHSIKTPVICEIE